MSRLTFDVQPEGFARRIAARELTVAEIRTHLAGSVERLAALDAVGIALFEGATFADLAAMSDLTAEEAAAMTPSELRQVLDACKKANPDFFAMLARLQAGGG